MAVDRSRVYTKAERDACRLRCPECRAALAVTWRRAHERGRSEDIYTIGKTSCPNKCDYDHDQV